MCIFRQISGQREIDFPPQKLLLLPFQPKQLNDDRRKDLISTRIAFITPGESTIKK
jgi:hypothetical protein